MSPPPAGAAAALAPAGPSHLWLPSNKMGITDTSRDGLRVKQHSPGASKAESQSWPVCGKGPRPFAHLVRVSAAMAGPGVLRALPVYHQALSRMRLPTLQ